MINTFATFADPRPEKTKEKEMSDSEKMTTECYECKNKRSIPNHAHIKCADPDQKMTGDPHGIKFGWFDYPGCFSPTWKTRLCSHFSPKL